MANATSNTAWIPRPLNRIGDLNSWKARMKRLCPQPKVGQIVYMESKKYDQDDDDYKYQRIGYKVLKLSRDNQPIWQRGMVVESCAEAFNQQAYI